PNHLWLAGFFSDAFQVSGNTFTVEQKDAFVLRVQDTDGAITIARQYICERDCEAYDMLHFSGQDMLVGGAFQGALTLPQKTFTPVSARDMFLFREPQPK
ncbi:MAG: hypothetical protein AAGJ35_15215, partial [Myxococcota bacterium]